MTRRSPDQSFADEPLNSDPLIAASVALTHNLRNTGAVLRVNAAADGSAAVRPAWPRRSRRMWIPASIEMTRITPASHRSAPFGNHLYLIACLSRSRDPRECSQLFRRFRLSAAQNGSPRPFQSPAHRPSLITQHSSLDTRRYHKKLPLSPTPPVLFP